MKASASTSKGSTSAGTPAPATMWSDVSLISPRAMPATGLWSTEPSGRLKNLSYFKTVKISTEPGSSPDRVILNVDVEEQSTGEFTVSGGYSTSDGFLGEVSVAERNLLGRGLYGKIGVSYGQYTKGANISFVDPYFLGYRVALGLDLFYKNRIRRATFPTEEKLSASARGWALRCEKTFQSRLGIPCIASRSRSSHIWRTAIIFIRTLSIRFRRPTDMAVGGDDLPGNVGKDEPELLRGRRSVLAVKRELANAEATTSLVGYTLTYNALDNNKSPTQGIMTEFKQDFAGAGGDVKFIRTTGDLYAYHEVVSDVVGSLHLQGGHISSWGGSDLRMLDHFQMGPNLVRGFAPAGIGPRDLTQYPWTGVYGDALGGTSYWGASLEFQCRCTSCPRIPV